MCRFTKFFLSTVLLLLISSMVLVGNVAEAAIKQPLVPVDADGNVGHIHSYKWIITKSATCVTNGTKVYKCNGCSDIYQTETIAALGHAYADATCTMPRKCTRCEATTGSPLLHNYSDATCTMPRKCTRCNQTIGSALGHSYVYTKVDTINHKITCSRCNYNNTTKHIFIDNKCKVCEYVKLEEITIDTCIHSYEWRTEKNPTCVKTGTKVYKCSKCEEISKTETIAALGHAYADATCTMPRKCTRCEATTGSPLLHSYTDATCTVAKTCTRCNQTIGSALGHNYIYTKVDTINHKITCSRCNYNNTTKHIFIDNKCKVCEYVKLQEITIDTCIHSYEWRTEKNPTCVKTGTKVYKCSKCEEISKTETIAALGHAYADATCTTAKTCTRCNQTIGSALGHNYSTKVGIFYNNEQHYEKYKCSCGATTTRNYKNHNIQDGKCTFGCGYVIQSDVEIKEECKHDGKAKIEKIYKDESNHLIRIICDSCGACIKEESKKHNSQVIERKSIDDKKHSETLKCIACNKKYSVEKQHSLDTKGVCECGFIKNNEEIKLEKIEFILGKEDKKEKEDKIYTIELGEKINLLEKVKLTPSNAKVNLKFMIVVGENGVAELETYTGKLEAKKVYTNGIKVRVIDNITELYDEVIIKINGNPEKEEEKPITKPDFDDVPNDAWYKDNVDKVVEDGLFNGTGDNQFSPNNAITRGMFVTVLARLDKADIENFANVFDDVKEDAYYQESISWAVANGIVKGMGDGKFAPDAQITREAMAVIIYNYIKSSHKGLLQENVNTDKFADQDEISAWAEEAVMALKAIGLINGKTNGNYKPKDIVTRAEGAAIFQRLSEKLKSDIVIEEVKKCSGENVLAEHKDKLLVEYEKINSDTHRIKYECSSCDTNWVDKPVAHDLKEGKCVCGYVCAHKGSTKTEEKYTDEKQLVKVTICEACNVVIKEEKVEEKVKCSGENVLAEHKDKLLVEYENINSDTHRIKYECSSCNTNWVDKPVAHDLKEGKCVCGYVCAHKGSTKTEEKYNDQKQLVKVTICEACNVVIKEEIIEVEQEDEKIENVNSNYSPEDFGQNKPKMDKNSYTDEDWDRMEAELKARVEKAGFGTRAGVVEAALYLASLDYAMPYRGTPMDRGADIGDYDKIGLNRTWGKSVKTTKEVTYNGTTYKKGYSAINGMDCGSFVTWAFINGGVIEEGDSVGFSTNRLTKDKGSLPGRMQSALQWSNLRAHPLKNVVDEVEPGDIIYTYGYRNNGRGWTHVGLIVGVDEDNIYVAESNTTTYSADTESHSLTVNKLVVTKIPKTYTGDVLGYVVLCDDTIYTAKNADGTENKGNMSVVWGN